jgi:hypothetical protein
VVNWGGPLPQIVGKLEQLLLEFVNVFEGFAAVKSVSVDGDDVQRLLGRFRDQRDALADGPTQWNGRQFVSSGSGHTIMNWGLFAIAVARKRSVR